MVVDRPALTTVINRPLRLGPAQVASQLFAHAFPLMSKTAGGVSWPLSLPLNPMLAVPPFAGMAGWRDGGMAGWRDGGIPARGGAVPVLAPEVLELRPETVGWPGELCAAASRGLSHIWIDSSADSVTSPVVLVWLVNGATLHRRCATCGRVATATDMGGCRGRGWPPRGPPDPGPGEPGRRIGEFAVAGDLTANLAANCPATAKCPTGSARTPGQARRQHPEKADTRHTGTERGPKPGQRRELQRHDHAAHVP